MAWDEGSGRWAGDESLTKPLWVVGGWNQPPAVASESFLAVRAASPEQMVVATSPCCQIAVWAFPTLAAGRIAIAPTGQRGDGVAFQKLEEEIESWGGGSEQKRVSITWKQRVSQD